MAAGAKSGSAFSAPSRFERSFGRFLVLLIEIGLVRGHFYVLKVHGRKSGNLFSVPVDPIAVEGKIYLVCPRGESSWVKNVRVAGELVLMRGRERGRYLAKETRVDERASILKAYLDSFAGEVQRFFPVKKGAPLEAFIALAERYPVFLLLPADPSTSIG